MVTGTKTVTSDWSFHSFESTLLCTLQLYFPSKRVNTYPALTRRSLPTRDGNAMRENSGMRKDSSYVWCDIRFDIFPLIFAPHLHSTYFFAFSSHFSKYSTWKKKEIQASFGVLTVDKEGNGEKGRKWEACVDFALLSLLLKRRI